MAEPAQPRSAVAAPLHSLSDLAEVLRCGSAKTARRRLMDAMAADPGLHVIRRGRTILLTPEHMLRVLRALEWRSISVSAARSGTRAAPSVSAGRRSPSANSPQEAARELMRKLRQQPKKTGSAERP
jgi:hypothetical protein